MSSKKRVLVVDDEPGILRFVRISLRVAGYDITTTSSGKEALQLAQAQNFDIMLLDILMHPLTGFDVLAKLREFSQIPVIAITAKSDLGTQAMDQGANGFISKPFMPEQLARKIEETLDVHKPGG